MALIVQKFGGTSVGSVERIHNVASRIKREVDAGNRVAVTVSAMAGETDRLVGLVKEFSALGTPQAWADYDQVVSSGELVSSGLVSLALQSMGLKARAWSGWQIPLLTDGTHGKARIREIKEDKLHAALNRGEVVVVAGFQGISPDGRITTLGRGGGDTSAVALAAALKADRCDIYTDVDGIYTADPRIVTTAHKLDKITFEEMLELASLGAKVLQSRSVEIAMNHNVRLQVLSSFVDAPGTLVVNEEEVVEQQRITGIAYSRDEARITLTGIANVPGMSAELFGPLSEAGINVDMIVQNVTEGGKETDITFTVTKSDLDRAVAAVEHSRKSLDFKSIHTDRNVSKISVVGIGMRSHAGVAQQMFKALADKNINIIVISTSEIKISVLIAEEYTELALRALHTAYGLDRETA